MLSQIKKYLKYEIKENKKIYANTLLNHILDEEEDLISYCEFLTNHSPIDEEDASDTITDYIKYGIEIEEVFNKMKARGLIFDYEIEENEGYFQLTTNLFSPIDILKEIEENDITNMEEFVSLMNEKEEETDENDFFSYEYEVGEE